MPHGGALMDVFVIGGREGRRGRCYLVTLFYDDIILHYSSNSFAISNINLSENRIPCSFIRNA